MRPNISQWPAPVFSIKVRVYFEDTDAGGIVYHANYLRYMERARSDWLRALGVAHADLAATDQIVLVVRDAKLDFLVPARLDDELEIDVRLLQLRGASIITAQTVTRVGAGQTLLATGVIRVAALNRLDGKVAAIPSWLLEKVEQ